VKKVQEEGKALSKSLNAISRHYLVPKMHEDLIDAQATAMGEIGDNLNGWRHLQHPWK
jgi:hypothetical protein